MLYTSAFKFNNCCLRPACFNAYSIIRLTLDDCVNDNSVNLKKKTGVTIDIIS